MRKPVLVLVLCGLGLSSLSYAEGVYRWEHNGKVFYSDQPPPTANAKEVDTHVPGKPQAPVNRAGPTSDERQALRSQECEKARARLIEYQNAPVLKQRNLKGEERELSANERIDVIVRVQSDIDQLCNEPDPGAASTDNFEDPIEEPEDLAEQFDE